MSWLTRFVNAMNPDRARRELEEELNSHIEEAVRHGRSPDEARRAFGAALRHQDESSDVRILPWLESLVSDIRFGLRQLAKRRGVSAAAILSLALAAGAVTGVFRLVEAIILRPLPINSPEKLHYAEIWARDREGKPSVQDDFDYPHFQRYRDLLKTQADLLLLAYSARQELILPGAEQPERFHRQYVSGNVFPIFGLKPAAGRLLTPEDDIKPGGHPVAVISHHYWTRRFGRDPAAIGKTFRYGKHVYEIVGVAPEGFVGTEPGVMADAFLPSVMNVDALDKPGWSWFRIWIRPKADVSVSTIKQRLQASLTNERREQLKDWIAGTSKERIDAHLSARVQLLPAAAGVSDLQRRFRRPLLILGILAALVLLIACANVANLRAAQNMSRARELAVRASIGAGRGRLVQLALVESALIAILASVIGTVFAWFSVPYVVSLLTPEENPVLLVLDADWSLLAFVSTLALVITFLFGFAPAVRASSLQPANVLKGGEDPRSHQRFINSLLGVQVAFCMTVLFVAGLLVSSFARLVHQPLGFVADNLLVISTETPRKTAGDSWTQSARQLRQFAGVESSAVSGWALMSGNRWTVAVRNNGIVSEVSPVALDISPGFFATMRIPFLGGRDFRPGDRQPNLDEDQRPTPGTAIVNEALARMWFKGDSPVGKSLEVYVSKDLVATVEIVGYVGDARYRNLRDPIYPTLYVPFEDRGNASFLLRSQPGRPLDPSYLRSEIPRVLPGSRVRNVLSQTALVNQHSIRERLLATLAVFFTAVALILAGMGLYGVLTYSVIRRRREIGIRMALGARSQDVVCRVALQVALPLLLGSLTGIAGGLAIERPIRALLFETKGAEAGMLVLPALALLLVAVAAALPPVTQAARVDPARTLRAD